MIPPHLIDQLRNTPVRKLIRTLERDGFTIHYHHGGDTLPIGTLRSVLEATRWTEGDLKRLGLLS